MSTPTKARLPRGCGCLLIPVVLIVLYYSSYFLLRGPLPANPQLIAHRGGKTTTPENTLASFRNAISLGADVLEFDVQMSADGVLVVIHDDTVDRTTNGTGLVGKMTSGQIFSLDAGNGEHVPTFAEVIQLAKESGVNILPEAKSPELYPGLGEKMVDELVAADYLDHAIIQSFVPETLEEIRAYNSDAQACLLTGLWKFSIPTAIPGQTIASCPMAEMVLLNPWMIRSAHTRGQEVYIWFGVIEHPLTVRLMRAFGADGIMVDDPAALAEVLER
jgi:glycerophosphoryl diester phosphodiesterase